MRQVEVGVADYYIVQLAPPLPQAEQVEVKKQRERYHQMSQRRHHSDTDNQTTDQS